MFAYWVGLDTPPDADARTLAAFNAFYDETHVPEVLANNRGFVRASRYELLVPDARGDFGPRWLAVYEMQDEAAAQAYIARNDGPQEGRPAYTPGLADFRTTIRWRMLWRQISAAGQAPDAYHGMFVVGMNVPDDTPPEGMREFNDFYTNIHVPEVMRWGGYASGLRFERFREFQHPAPGCPRFLAIYQGDQAATEASQQRSFGSSSPRPSSVRFTDGPPTWERHDTLWRHVYKTISTLES
jgi:hypothetical protein